MFWSHLIFLQIHYVKFIFFISLFDWNCVQYNTYRTYLLRKPNSTLTTFFTLISNTPCLSLTVFLSALSNQRRTRTTYTMLYLHHILKTLPSKAVNGIQSCWTIAVNQRSGAGPKSCVSHVWLLAKRCRLTNIWDFDLYCRTNTRVVCAL